MFCAVDCCLLRKYYRTLQKRFPLKLCTICRYGTGCNASISLRSCTYNFIVFDFFLYAMVNFIGKAAVEIKPLRMQSHYCLPHVLYEALTLPGCNKINFCCLCFLLQFIPQNYQERFTLCVNMYDTAKYVCTVNQEPCM